MTTQLDMRCTCARCVNRTEQTYELNAACNNCGWKGTALMRKGDRPSTFKDCPQCGCNGTLGFSPLTIEREEKA